MHRLHSRMVPHTVSFLSLYFMLFIAGCGSSEPNEAPVAETQAADQKKIIELAKKGKNFGQIRAIMKGETPNPTDSKKKN